MKIKLIEPIAISLPMLKPVIMAGEEVTRADNVLVRIETDDGMVGWGEAASAPVMTGDTLESIVSAVHYLEPALRGRDPADIAGAHVAMDGRMYGNHGAKAAIEIALYDLAGKAYAKALKLNPNHTGALEYQGVLFIKLGQVDKAKANLAKIKAISGEGGEEYKDLAEAIG